METIAATIQRLLPELPDKELANLVTYLESEGCQYGKDLVYLEADDIRPHLKIFYVRKLLKGLKASGTDESSSMVTTTSIVQAEASTSAQNFIATVPKNSNRWLQEFVVSWADLPRETLEDCEGGRRPSLQMRWQLVKIVGSSVAKHDPSPGITAARHVARLVVNKYPWSFGDITSAGDIIGDGAASLARQLQSFLENRWRPNRNTKRTADDLEQTEDQPSAKRFKGPTVSYGYVEWQPDCHPATWDSLHEEKSLLLANSSSGGEDVSGSWKPLTPCSERR